MTAFRFHRGSFTWALTMLGAGHKVRRGCHPQGFYLHRRNGLVLNHNMLEIRHVSEESATAWDWEIFRDSAVPAKETLEDVVKDLMNRDRAASVAFLSEWDDGLHVQFASSDIHFRIEGNTVTRVFPS